MDRLKNWVQWDAKCKNCNDVLKIKTRRKCILCSKIYIGFLFCRECSIKENHHALGFLAPKRYCLNCYINASSTMEITNNDSQYKDEGNPIHDEIKEDIIHKAEMHAIQKT